jgi:hypothetical protein
MYRTTPKESQSQIQKIYNNNNQSLITKLWDRLWILNKLYRADNHFILSQVILYIISLMNMSFFFFTSSTNAILNLPLLFFIPST